MKARTVQVGAILSNPYRKDRNYDETKVQALVSSIRATGMWPTLIGRENDAGEVELAAGHHRCQALLELYGEDYEVTVHIHPFTNLEMLGVLARENSDDWRASPQTFLDTVEALVEALGAGEVELPAVSAHTSRSMIRVAPGYEVGHEGTDPKAYTTATLNVVLGMDRNVVSVFLNLLGLIERKEIKKTDLDNMTYTDMFEFLKAHHKRADDKKKEVQAKAQLRKAVADKKALETNAETVNSIIGSTDDPDSGQEQLGLSSQSSELEDLREDAEKRAADARRKLDDLGSGFGRKSGPKSTPDFVKSIVKTFGALLTDGDKTIRRLKEEKLSQKQVTKIVDELEAVKQRCDETIKVLTGS